MFWFRVHTRIIFKDLFKMDMDMYKTRPSFETMVKDLLKFSVFRSSEDEDFWTEIVKYEANESAGSVFAIKYKKPLSSFGDFVGLKFPQRNSILMLTINRIERTNKFNIGLLVQGEEEDEDWQEVIYLNDIFDEDVLYSEVLDVIKSHPPSSKILQLLKKKYNKPALPPLSPEGGTK